MRLLAVVGPTASGKSDLALALSVKMNGEIVSADSRQIYKLLDIGTSKPSSEDRKKTRHHFVDILDPKQDYNAGTFGIEARDRVIEICGRGKQPILVGGSGLYVKAVIDGFFDGPGQDSEFRSLLEDRARNEGSQALLNELSKVDPESAVVMEASKPRRIIRALEVFHITGKRLSEFHKEQSTAASFETTQFGLEWARPQLYERINRRVDLMFSDGLIEEAKHLLNEGYEPSLNALNTVGYKEVFEYLKGNLSYDDMAELMKRNSRRFAKRQLTWFRRDDRINWINMVENIRIENVVDMIAEEFVPS
jgi:tRNA dimethylallyltransferase